MVWSVVDIHDHKWSIFGGSAVEGTLSRVHAFLLILRAGGEVPKWKDDLQDQSEDS